MSHASDWESLIAEMRERGVEFEPGLTTGEIRRTQSRYKFKFPPDLAEFLQTALPVSNNFAAWRADDDSQLRRMLAWPVDGIVFDVLHNQFWLEAWGERPEVAQEAEAIARSHMSHAPQLVPIYLHRMIPSEPHLDGNPVFSVYQTDIIYYGYNLADYLRNEFRLDGREPWPDEVRDVPY